VYFYFDLEMKESAKSPFPALDYFWRTNSMQKSCRSKFRFQFHCRPTKIKVKFKGRGLDSSWSCLDRESRSWQFQKACLDNWEVSILSRHHLTNPKVSIEIKKSIKTWHFWSISTVVSIAIESEFILSFFSIKISQIVKIFEPSKMFW
jgi:hypothetical protein